MIHDIPLKPGVVVIISGVDIDCSAKPKNPKIGLRPPSINIPSPGSPTAQTPTAALKTQGSEAISSIDRLNLPKSGVLQTPLSPFAPQESTLKVPAKSWASMVNTPLVPMFQKPDASRNESSQSSINSSFGGKGPGLAALNTSTLNMLATSGLSNDAQLLAIQLVMSGILRPTEIVETTKQDQALSPSPAGKKKGTHGNWRAPSSAKHPSGGLRSGMPKTSGLKNNVLKSSGLAGRSIDSAPTESLRTKDFSPELLEDIPAWLRSLRLHKYNSCFESMTWREMVVMDDTMLEKKGVTAMGARRRLIRTFDHVRREMGMEEISNATPATSALPSGTALTPVGSAVRDGPDGSQKAAPTTSLSADSPVFMPTGKAPHCTVPALAVA